MDDRDYTAIGLMTSWRMERRDDWRGWDLVGVDENRIVEQFIPDAAVDVILNAVGATKNDALGGGR